MSRQIINYTAFSAGEISPRAYARVETEEYKKALETADNTVVLAQGPVRRRGGTEYIAETKDSSAVSRLIDYQVSQSTAFCLEFGNNYIRFFDSLGQVVESDLTITGITAADPAVVTSTGHLLSDGDHVYITGVVGMTEVNSATIAYKVNNKTANTFELQTSAGVDIDASAFTAYSSGGVANRIYEIVSPYTTAQVQDIQYAQSGVKMYLTHPDVPQKLLKRTTDTDWSINTISFFPTPTYESGFEPDTTMTPTATTGLGVTFTAGAAHFLQADIGRQIMNLSTDETGRASITSITSTTVAVCDIVEDFTDTSAIASGDWKIDLSPVCDLEFNGSQAGAVINIRPEYSSGSFGMRTAITAITKASPAVVTAASHGFENGDTVVLTDILGMTQLNDLTFTVEGETTDTFQLKGENSIGYTTYASGGIVRKVLDDIGIDAFRSQDVGRYILANGGVMQVVAVNSAQDIDVEILKSLNDTITTGAWSLEEPTWTVARGYPKSVGLFQQRLIYGGTTTLPQTLWFSEIGIFDGFGAGPDNEDSIQVELSSNQVNKISWIAPARDLVIGTTGGELTISSGSGNTAISPSNILQRARTALGSAVQQVVNVREEILFVQGSSRKIITFRYDFNLDGYAGDDLTFLAEHLTEDGLKEIVYAQEPDTLLYAVTDGGNMLTGTYDRAKKIIAWTKSDTDGSFESVQSIPVSNRDQVWTIVKRTVNGSTFRYVEVMTNEDGVSDIDGFSDSFLTLSNPLVITGITLANPAVVTSASHGMLDGAEVIIKDIVNPPASELDADKSDITSINNSHYVVANKTTNTYELAGLDTSAFNAYGSGGNGFEKVTTITGLDHLEGKTVQVKVDGAAHPNEVVLSGSITLDAAAGEIVIGLPYTTTIKTLSADFNSQLGSMQGQRVRWARPLLHVNKSTSPLLNGEYIPARNTSDKMDQKTPLFSGYFEYGPLLWSNTAALTLTTSAPFPLMLLGITGTIDSGVK